LEEEERKRGKSDSWPKENSNSRKRVREVSLEPIGEKCPTSYKGDTVASVGPS